MHFVNMVLPFYDAALKEKWSRTLRFPFLNAERY
jgi:hypothetical protein